MQEIFDCACRLHDLGACHVVYHDACRVQTGGLLESRNSTIARLTSPGSSCMVQCPLSPRMIKDFKHGIEKVPPASVTRCIAGERIEHHAKGLSHVALELGFRLVWLLDVQLVELLFPVDSSHDFRGPVSSPTAREVRDAEEAHALKTSGRSKAQ